MFSFPSPPHTFQSRFTILLFLSAFSFVNTLRMLLLAQCHPGSLMVPSLTSSEPLLTCHIIRVPFLTASHKRKSHPWKSVSLTLCHFFPTILYRFTLHIMCFLSVPPLEYTLGEGRGLFSLLLTTVSHVSRTMSGMW